MTITEKAVIGSVDCAQSIRTFRTDHRRSMMRSKYFLNVLGNSLGTPRGTSFSVQAFQSNFIYLRHILHTLM